MIDNFDIILPLLNFDCGDTFYHCQILQRKKDGNDHDHKLLKTYCINSIDHWHKKKSEIITLCKAFNARAYINVNRRSYKQVTLTTLTLIVEALKTDLYERGRFAFDSACGKTSVDNFWTVDIDDNDIGNIDTIRTTIQSLQPHGINKIIAVIPTVNGVHFITHKFDLSQFRQHYPNIDVHKNNPTLLYYE